VVRHRLVKQILRAYTREHERENPQEHKTPPIVKKEKPE
jgi:hypothetical protein